MPSSTYLRGKVTDHVLRNVAYTSPTIVYVSLHTSDPTIAGTPGTEISAGWYARQVGTFAAQVTAGQTSNSVWVTCCSLRLCLLPRLSLSLTYLVGCLVN